MEENNKEIQIIDENTTQDQVVEVPVSEITPVEVPTIEEVEPQEEDNKHILTFNN